MIYFKDLNVSVRTYMTFWYDLVQKLELTLNNMKDKGLKCEIYKSLALHKPKWNI